MSEIARSETEVTIRNFFVKKRILHAAILAAALLAVLIFRPPAQGAPPSYTLGEIPDQTVWHGGTASFLVNWDDEAAASFSMVADPQPYGTMSLEAVEGADWVFTYVPDPSDNTDFTVTLTASFADQTASQSFVITPQSNLPPEQSVFGNHPHEPPVVTTYEIQVFKRTNPTAESFNYLDMQTQVVQIIGENVVIEEGHENGLFEAYFDGSRRDIKEMEIIGETVIFASSARLKQTNVTIFARYLRFEGDGRLQTTPEEISEVAAQFTDGVDGLKAGDITLNIAQLDYETPGVKFDLTGGQGQPGGAGQHGVKGFSAPNYWGSISCDYYLDDARYTAPAGQFISYSKCGDGGTISGTSVWPSNGTDAQASGKPGEGGAGGNLSSNYDLSGGYSLSGGVSGTPNYPVPYQNYYRGGYPGYPRYALHVNFYWDTWSACVSYNVYKNPSWPTQKGADAAVTMPETEAGPEGRYDAPESFHAWLHPLMLRKVLNHAREDYLGEYVSEAHARLEEYISIMDAYKANTSPNARDMIEYELEQIYDEMQILLQQMENNLDYFGNPAGWVPMLSFEVNYAMFGQEIDRAIRMLYLAYWIRTTEKDEGDKADALVAARAELKLEIQQAKADYDDAANDIPLLKSKAENLKLEIFETQIKLQTREQELIEQTQDPVWLACLKGALKGAAWACQVVPVYQPGIGAMGQGLEQVSDVDPSAPWESIIGKRNVATSFMDSGFDIAALDQKTAKDAIDPYAVESNALTYLNTMRSASSDLSSGLGDIENFISENKAPRSGMMSELERLKSMDPEYQEIVEEIEALMLKNREFTDKLIRTMQKVAVLSNLITRNMLAIDAMNRDAAPGLLVCDGRASAYLDDMEQRTYNRLLKYHYYLAKAYEYRLLKPYSEPLSLQGLLEKFKEIALVNGDHTITPAQFDAFRALYEDKLSSVADEIFKDYNNSNIELTTGLPFRLTPEDIGRLNQGETVTLNLMEAGYFFPDEENIRIVGLEVYDIKTQPIGGSYGSNPMIRVRTEHSGISNFKTNGAIYQFRHYNSETENPIIWEARWSPDLEILQQTKPSAASESLLCALLDSSDCQNLMFFSRPSAWADLRISRDCRDKTCETINIEKLIFKLDFDLMPRNESLARKDLEIMVSKVSAGSEVSTESGFMPNFVLNRPDLNGRQDARGRALRIYEYSSEAVEVTAQNSYGGWRFNKWTDRYGGDLPDGPLYSPTIRLIPRDDIIITAQYIPVGRCNCEADFDGDGDVDGDDLAKSYQNGIGLSKLAEEFGRIDCNCNQ